MDDNMEKNSLIILIVVLLCILIGIGAYVYDSHESSYKNITLNTVQFEVPDSNASVVEQNGAYWTYEDEKNQIQILEYDGNKCNMSDISKLKTFKDMKEDIRVGNTIQDKENLSYNYAEAMKQYNCIQNYSNHNVFIITKNRDDMEHILKTLKLTRNDINTTDTGNSSENKSENKTDKLTSANLSFDEVDQYFDGDWKTNISNITK